MKKTYCIDCGMEISYKSKRCRKCMGISQKGENNPNYRNGNCLGFHYCSDCGREIGYQAIRCNSCANKITSAKPRSEKWKQKRSERMLKNNPFKGKCLTEEHKQKLKENHPDISGENNPNWKGGKQSNYCVDCGKEIVNRYAKRCKSCAYSGERHYNWQGGKSPYPIEFNQELRQKIKERDDYTCQNCGLTEEEHLMVWGRILSVHHIDYNKKNSQENNLITLCESCHKRANYRRKYWQQFYEEKIKQFSPKEE